MKWTRRKTISLGTIFVTITILWFTALSQRRLSVAEFEQLRSDPNFPWHAIEMLGPPTYQYELTSGSGTYFEWELSDGYASSLNWPAGRVTTEKEPVFTYVKRRLYRQMGWSY